MLRTILLSMTLTGASLLAMTQDRIRITSGNDIVIATLHDNPAAQALRAMLPLELSMRDHLRQEKTGTLPQDLPSAPRQRDFAVGTLGLWSNGDFVIYYRAGRVPSPGIVVLGEVPGDVSIFDHPDPVTISIEAVD